MTHLPTRSRGRERRFPPTRRRFLWAVGLGALVVLAGAAYLAARSRGPEPPAPVPVAVAVHTGPPIDSLAFRQLRPGLEDHMTKPRIGFRWVYRPPAGESDSVRYRVRLTGSDGVTVLSGESWEPHMNLDLAEEFPPGECEWWVEAERSEGWVRSVSERFLLRP